MCVCVCVYICIYIYIYIYIYLRVYTYTHIVTRYQFWTIEDSVYKKKERKEKKTHLDQKKKHAYCNSIPVLDYRGFRVQKRSCGAHVPHHFAPNPKPLFPRNKTLLKPRGSPQPEKEGGGEGEGGGGGVGGLRERQQRKKIKHKIGHKK
jgi:hypothetical protein